MPNSSSIQSEQSFDTSTIQSVQTPSTGFTPFSWVDSPRAHPASQRHVDFTAQAMDIVNGVALCLEILEYDGLEVEQDHPALKPLTPITREKYAAFVFITESLEYSVKTFIGHAATHAEAVGLAHVAMQNNPLAEGFVVERVEVEYE